MISINNDTKRSRPPIISAMAISDGPNVSHALGSPTSWQPVRSHRWRLCRTAMREAVGHDLSARFSLQRVVLQRLRLPSARFQIARFERDLPRNPRSHGPPTHRRKRRPAARARHGVAIASAYCRHFAWRAFHAIARAEQLLHVMSDLMGQNIGFGESRPAPRSARHSWKIRDRDTPGGRADIERPHRGPSHSTLAARRLAGRLTSGLGG